MFFHIFQKHNLIFLRFHQISDDIQKRGRRGTYSFNQTQSQCGIRAEQMLNLNQAILPKEFKFKETGQHLAKMIRLEKQVCFDREKSPTFMYVQNPIFRDLRQRLERRKMRMKSKIKKRKNQNQNSQRN